LLHPIDPTYAAIVSYTYICEPCRQALGLPAERSYLNRIKREAGGFGGSATTSRPPREVTRGPSGKPSLITTQLADLRLTIPAGCYCSCVSSGHDPWQCTGERQFVTGGRPGSGAVDELAQQLGREPIPETILAAHQGCQVMVAYILALYFGSSDQERAVIESSLERERYDDQLKLLRDLLSEERPDLMSTKPYRDLKANLKKLAKFRDVVAHSIPVGGDFFTRFRRVGAENETIHISEEDLAEHLDLSHALKSQLWFVPIYLNLGAAS
jgi:hypothetical protein